MTPRPCRVLLSLFGWTIAAGVGPALADDPKNADSPEAVAKRLAPGVARPPRVGRHARRHPPGEPARAERRLVPHGRRRRPASTGKATRKRYDRDGDGRIARDEFPGPDADFARLDRDRDRAPDRGRFRLLAATPSTPIARRHRSSIGSTATATARSPARSSTPSSSGPTRGGLGFLSLADLQDACRRPPHLPPRQRRRPPPARRARRRRR